MAVANQTHDIVINGVGYRIVPGSLSIARANDFTARISTGGNLTYSDLDNWSVLTQTNWTHGLGQENFYEASALQDVEKFFESVGVETRIEGRLQLAAQVAVSDAGFVAYAFCDAGNYCFAGGATSIRYYDPTLDVWANAKTGNAAAVTDLAVFGGKLYAALGDSTDMVSCANPSGAPTTWAAETGVKRSYLKVWQKKLWGSNGATVYSYDGSTWSAGAVVGDAGTKITSIEVSGSYLVVGKEDRLYVSSDGANFAEVDLRLPQYSGNFKRMKLFGGYLWCASLAKVYKVGGLGGGITIADQTPKLRGSDARVLYGWGRPVDMTYSTADLFVLFNAAENSYPAVLAWNGLGWHTIYKGAAAATGYSVYFSRVAGRLFINDGSTRAQTYNTLNDTPAADYPTSGTWYIRFSIDDLGFQDIDKAFKEIFLVCGNLTASRKISAYYSTDKGGTWAALAAEATSGTQVSIPFSASQAAISAKEVWIELRFSTNGATVTPYVEAFGIRRILRPQILFVISGTLRIADSVAQLDGAVDPQTAADKIAALISASNVVTPITFDSPDGYRHKGALTNLSFHETLARET